MFQQAYHFNVRKELTWQLGDICSSCTAYFPAHFDISVSRYLDFNCFCENVLWMPGSLRTAPSTPAISLWLYRALLSKMSFWSLPSSVPWLLLCAWCRAELSFAYLLVENITKCVYISLRLCALYALRCYGQGQAVGSAPAL